jgi:formylglycine-generating enzyme required for sulfatase activity
LKKPPIKLIHNMKTHRHLVRPLILAALILTGFVTPPRAQEVIIPDPNLNTAIREALGKPAGPLTQLDMLTLTNFGAVFRNITNVQGLEAARNLTSLDLQDNRITNVNILTNLTRLVFLDLSENRFPKLTLPTGMTNLTTLRAEVGGLTKITLPAGLTKLTSLRLGFNQLTSLTLPADMTNLSVLSVYLNELTNLTLPPMLTSLTNLNLDGNRLSTLILPASMTKLDTLIASANQLTSFTVPADMTNLIFLRLNDNQLTNVTLPARLNHLSLLSLLGNQLSRLTLPAGMIHLSGLVLTSNQLTTLTLPPDLDHLTQIELARNELTSLILPADLTSLAFLNLTDNQLTNLTLPPDLQQLIGLFAGGNPLTTFVLSEPLAATGMASVVSSFRDRGIPVFTYPLVAQLVRPLALAGSFKFGITGPPGVYTVLGSTNFTTWSPVGAASNPLGSVNFHDVSTNVLPQKYYRLLLQAPPANMVFIPPNTFTMGSPTNELHRRPNEGPQTTVTLSRGFWIGKYEVTQGEYLDVAGTNPSLFPGDLSRPISSVSWPDATNYCWLLTQRELAAGRISPGTQYRLPTEAEWECAARAGTSTRFSYGDDPDYADLPNYAWQSIDDGLTVHPVGQKFPNPWGLYDMYGNVLEWCQDWFGPLPGGSVIDPQGPPSNAIGDKVTRGGAFDFGGSFCRSASRLSFGSHPALNDWNLGFRVVLAVEPQ